MAKGFPYFKFIATEWLTGDIVFEDFELQGIFINVCALYWHRDGKITLDEIKRRLKNDRLLELTDRFFSVNDGSISIKFLDEQLVAAGHISKVNSKNGSKGGRPKATPALEEKPVALQSLTETKPKKSKEEIEEEEEIELKEIKSIYNTLVSEIGNDDLKLLKITSEYINEKKPVFSKPYVDMWNAFSGIYGTAKIISISKTRVSKLRVRLNDPNFNFPQILRKAANQKYALQSSWFTFDFLISNDTNYLKVIEGKYSLQQTIQKSETGLAPLKD